MEVLLVLFLIAVLAGIAIPAFSTWLPNYHLKAAARQVVSDLQLTKMTAVKNNRNCTVCFNQTVDGERYDYVAFIEEDNDLEYDPGEVRISMLHLSEYGGVGYDRSLGGGDGLTFIQNDENLPAISFKPNGLPVNNSGGLGMGTIFLKNSVGGKAKIVLSSAGNIRIE